MTSSGIQNVLNIDQRKLWEIPTYIYIYIYITKCKTLRPISNLNFSITIVIYKNEKIYYIS